MNFVGHAIVALWSRRDPRWVLGSMLPDFAGMTSNRLQGAREPVVHAGIALHLQTDDLFHRSAHFVDWTRSGEETLRAAGVGPGPAAAAAHVGAELLLDGLLLADEPHLADAYRDALSIDLARIGLELRGAGLDRLAFLLGRLADHGLPREYCTPEGVLDRLERALHARPALALTERDLDPTLAWLRAIRPRIATDARALLDELRAGLLARAAIAPRLVAGA